MTDHDYRLEELTRRMSEIEATKPAVLDVRLTTLSETVKQLAEEVRTMKRAFYTFALSVTASAVLFALTIFANR